MSLINAGHLGSLGSMMPGRRKVRYFKRAKRDTFGPPVQLIAEIRPARKREAQSSEAASTARSREFVFMRPEIGAIAFREGDVFQDGDGSGATYWQVAADGVGDEMLDQRIRVVVEQTVDPTVIAR